MVDTPFTSLVVDIKVLEVVVEIDTTSTQVSSEQSSVGGKDGSYVDMPLSAESNSETSLPFVEVGDDSSLGLSACKLGVSSCARRKRKDVPLRGTMRQCIQRQWLRWSRGRWVERGYRRGSRDQSSIRSSYSSAKFMGRWKNSLPVVAGSSVE